MDQGVGVNYSELFRVQAGATDNSNRCSPTNTQPWDLLAYE